MYLTKHRNRDSLRYVRCNFLVLLLGTILLLFSGSAKSSRSRKDAIEKFMAEFRLRSGDPFGQHALLVELQASHPTLFEFVSVDHFEELSSALFGKGLSTACGRWGDIPRKRMVWHIGLKDRGTIEAQLREMVQRRSRAKDSGHPTFQIVVVSDGAAVEDAGDVGIWSAGAVLSKCAVHTAVGGCHPDAALPIVLDLGTENTALWTHQGYGGHSSKRFHGVDIWSELLFSLRTVLPSTLLHLSGSHHASQAVQALIQQHKQSEPVFDDATDGVATVTLAALLTAMRVRSDQGGGGDSSDEHMWRPPVSALRHETFLIYGAGTLARRIADLIFHAMTAGSGVPPRRGRDRIWIMDPDTGLHVRQPDLEMRHGRPPESPYHKHPVRITNPDTDSRRRRDNADVAAAVEASGATVLIGAGRRRGAFSRDALRSVRRNSRYGHGVVLITGPVNNGSVECRAHDVWHWSLDHDGQTLFAGGEDTGVHASYSPAAGRFDLACGETRAPAQLSAVYVFPGVAAGVHAARARIVSDGMLVAAAEGLARLVKLQELKEGSLLPRYSRLRDVSLEVGVQVAEAAQREGLSHASSPQGVEALRAWLRSRRYEPGQSAAHTPQPAADSDWQPPRPREEIRVSPSTGRDPSAAGGFVQTASSHRPLESERVCAGRAGSCSPGGDGGGGGGGGGRPRAG